MILRQKEHLKEQLHVEKGNVTQSKHSLPWGPDTSGVCKMISGGRQIILEK